MSGDDHGGARSKALLRVPLSLTHEGAHPLPAEAAIYVTRVHRLAAGDRFLAFDPARSVEAEVAIVEVHKRGVTVQIASIRRATRAPLRQVTLLQGTCKGDKMDAIVRDATELGATTIVPVITERSVARPDAGRAERWRRIAVEAARQCGRGEVPAIDDPAALAALLARGVAEGTRAFCLDPGAQTPFGSALLALDPAAPLSFLVGPEGGLSEVEITAARQAGHAPVRLGGLVLRAETVCAAVLGAVAIVTDAAARAGDGAQDHP